MNIEDTSMAADEFVSEDGQLSAVVTAMKSNVQLILVRVVFSTDLESAVVDHDRLRLECVLSLVSKCQCSLNNNDLELWCGDIDKQSHAGWDIDSIIFDRWEVSAPRVRVTPPESISHISAHDNCSSQLYRYLEACLWGDGQFLSDCAVNGCVCYCRHSTINSVDCDLDVGNDSSEVGSRNG